MIQLKSLKTTVLPTKTDLRASATTTATTPVKTSKKKLLQYFLLWNIVHKTSFTPAPHPHAHPLKISCWVRSFVKF